ncbi:hypothetical protein N656DRAFT_518302 [Canariomyces notabilis]|uniref:Uncharacterized protein n=1 Tax=Canariomyces notabilis TaxID=2074819 RepID=A0AAN6QBP6_9PEZI|nr:hypothetical protein N656DRAFT_518302 [Canariomyces arenarius]
MRPCGTSGAVGALFTRAGLCCPRCERDGRQFFIIHTHIRACCALALGKAERQLEGSQGAYHIASRQCNEYQNLVSFGSRKRGSCIQSAFEEEVGHHAMQECDGILTGWKLSRLRVQVLVPARTTWEFRHCHRKTPGEGGSCSF